MELLDANRIDIARGTRAMSHSAAVRLAAVKHGLDRGATLARSGILYSGSALSILLSEKLAVRVLARHSGAGYATTSAGSARPVRPCGSILGPLP